MVRGGQKPNVGIVRCPRRHVRTQTEHETVNVGMPSKRRHSLCLLQFTMPMAIVRAGFVVSIIASDTK